MGLVIIVKDAVKDIVRCLLLKPLARVLVAVRPYAEEITNDNTIRLIGSHPGKITFRHNVFIKNPHRLRLGKNVLFNDNSYINAKGGIEIGSNVVIGPGCSIFTNNHRGSIFFGNVTSSPVYIGSNVWLAANVTITPGVSIGNNVIVGAGAVVTTDIPDNSIAGGVPARVLRELTLPFEPKR